MKEHVQVPKEYEVTEFVDTDEEGIRQYLLSFTSEEERKSVMKNLTLANIFFRDLNSNLIHSVCDVNKHPDLKFLREKNPESILKGVKDIMPRILFGSPKEQELKTSQVFSF